MSGQYSHYIVHDTTGAFFQGAQERPARIDTLVDCGANEPAFRAGIFKAVFHTGRYKDFYSQK